MTYQSALDTVSSPGVLLGSRVEIFPSQPIAELNTKNGMAYAARFRTESTADLYAIICLTGLPPRIEAVTSMRTIDNPGVVRLVEAGVVSWTGGTQAYALVYQRPLAPRMMSSLDETRPLLNEDIISHHFITPMIGALIALSNAGIVHNAIHPGNIYWRIGNATPPQIGECLSTPAGLSQALIFEPIERSMAMPLGRGVGIAADDCYAFGMCLGFLVIGKNPFHGLDDQAIIEAKMQRGSFSCVVGNHRLSPTHIEILRGLLADDADQRWSANDLDQWLGGRRMTPKNSDLGRRASRHFEFAGKEYWQASHLAAAFANNVGDAARIIETDSLSKWLRRAMNDHERANFVESAISDLKQSGKTAHYEDQLVARICMALDQAAPIRYRGLSTMPGGIASLLIDTALTGNNIAPLSEIISSKMVALWIGMQKETKPEFLTMMQQFDKMKSLVEKTTFGNGIERITYELNTSLPCLSPMLRGQYVATPKMLLPALEYIASTGNRPREPIDRHIAAFLIVRDKRGESLFTGISAPEGSVQRGLAILTLFSELQYRHGPENLPQLAAWLAPFVEPATRNFLSKASRERIQKQIRETISKGDLGALLRLVDDSKRIERDRQDFMAARILYLNIQKEIAGLEVKINNRESVVRASGKPMAASISSFLAIILIFAAILRALFEVWFQ
jgi:hypothetical protein